MQSGQTQALAPLPEGVLPTDRHLPDGTVVYSLTAHALAEMERHRWIESERAGHDLGQETYHDWLRRSWTGWVRACLLQHLSGWRRWTAFSKRHYALFRRGSVERQVPTRILRSVADILVRGGENLDVLNWAVEQREELEAVIWLLERIDINAVRQRLLTDHIRLFMPD